MTRATSRARVRLGLAGAGVLMTALSFATPADALGNNRFVQRSCGRNWVSSGFRADGYNWAATETAAGTCAGRLSAALERHDGYVSQRKYGNSWEVYVLIRWGGTRATRGLHWGCDTCGVTYT
jgi:hypothetical protein